MYSVKLISCQTVQVFFKDHTKNVIYFFYTFTTNRRICCIWSWQWANEKWIVSPRGINCEDVHFAILTEYHHLCYVLFLSHFGVELCWWQAGKTLDAQSNLKGENSPLGACRDQVTRAGQKHNSPRLPIFLCVRWAVLMGNSSAGPGHIFTLFLFSLWVHSIRSRQRTIWDCQTLDEPNKLMLSELRVPGRAGNHGVPLLKMTHRSSGTPAGTICSYF